MTAGRSRRKGPARTSQPAADGPASRGSGLKVAARLAGAEVNLSRGALVAGCGNSRVTRPGQAADPGAGTEIQGGQDARIAQYEQATQRRPATQRGAPG